MSIIQVRAESVYDLKSVLCPLTDIITDTNLKFYAPEKSKPITNKKTESSSRYESKTSSITRSQSKHSTFDTDRAKNTSNSKNVQSKQDLKKQKARKQKEKRRQAVESESDTGFDTGADTESFIDSSSSESESDTESDPSVRNRKKTVNKIDCSKGRIVILDVDSTQTVMVYLTIYGSYFEEFYCRDAEKDVGIKLSCLSTVLKLASDDSSLTFTIPESEINFMHFVGTKRNREIKTELQLIEPRVGKYTIPNERLKYPTVYMSSKTFHKMCCEMKKIGEIIQIEYCHRTITFSCKNDLLKHSVKYGEDKEIMAVVNPLNETIMKKLDLGTVIKFSKSRHPEFSFCVGITLNPGVGTPVTFSYDMQEFGFIVFCLSSITEDGELPGTRDECFDSSGDEDLCDEEDVLPI